MAVALLLLLLPFGSLHNMLASTEQFNLQLTDNKALWTGLSKYNIVP